MEETEIKKKSFVSFMQANSGLGSVMSALCSRGRPNAIALSIDMCSLKGVWGFFV